jgi:hypothetical protein
VIPHCGERGGRGGSGSVGALGFESPRGGGGGRGGGGLGSGGRDGGGEGTSHLRAVQRIKREFREVLKSEDTSKNQIKVDLVEFYRIKRTI